MILSFRPIKVWPDGWQTPKDRPSTPFYASYRQTLEDLDRELRHREALDAFLQVAATEADVRLDGQLRANATVSHPGVILTVETRRNGSEVYATDRFSHWQANLRAIALGLEALRKVERYGIAERGQQYAGFRELGAGAPIAVGSVMTVEQAARCIAEASGQDWSVEIGDDPFFALALYRDAARIHHPDAGGDPEIFRRITEARDLLEAHHG